MVHGQGEWRQELPGLSAYDGHTQQAVAARAGDQLDETRAPIVNDRPVQFSQIHPGDLGVQPLLLGLLQGVADPRDFRVHEDHLRNQRAVRTQRPQALQGIDRRMPALMRCCVGQLPPARHVTGGKNARKGGFQGFIHIEGFQAQFLQAHPPPARLATDGQNHQVKVGPHLALWRLQLSPKASARIGRLALEHLAVEQHTHTVRPQSVLDHLTDRRTLLRQQPRALLDQGDRRAQPRQRLREFAAHGAATQDQKTIGSCGQAGQMVPQGIAG